MLFRLLNCDDQTIFWEFLRLAAHETSLSAVRNAPLLARYAQNWGRDGDFGCAAFREQNLATNEEVTGLAWARVFPQNQPGFGFVGADVPEISLAVRPEFSRQGLGTALLNGLIAEAETRCIALSLSVRATNSSAVGLYQKAGFEKVEGSESLNRAGSLSFKMRLDFR